MCYSDETMNTSNSLRGSRSTLSRRRDKPWRISAQLPDQKAPASGWNCIHLIIIIIIIIIITIIIIIIIIIINEFV